jgi:hypothetical protein
VFACRGWPKADVVPKAGESESCLEEFVGCSIPLVVGFVVPKPPAPKVPVPPCCCCCCWLEFAPPPNPKPVLDVF